MPRASALAEQLANSTQVFDHRESVSTRRRISIEAEAFAQRCSKCLSPCHTACAECFVPLTDRSKKKSPCGCRCASSSAGALGVLACLATTITLLVVWLQHELAPPIPSPPPPRMSRCSAGIDSTYIVQKEDSCSSISRNHGVPRFDLVDRNTTRSCCESDAIEADDVVEFCKPLPRSRWRARGLPQEKVVMTYIGGVGFLPSPTRYGLADRRCCARVASISVAACADLLRMHVWVTVLFAVLSRLPESVNVVALVSCSRLPPDVLEGFQSPIYWVEYAPSARLIHCMTYRTPRRLRLTQLAKETLSSVRIRIVSSQSAKCIKATVSMLIVAPRITRRRSQAVEVAETRL